MTMKKTVGDRVRQRRFERIVEDGLRISECFVAEPVLATTGKGHYQSRGVEGLKEDQSFMVKMKLGDKAEELAADAAAWRKRAGSLLEPEQDHWLSLSMNERLAALDDIFMDYQRMGGSLEPDPDPQSPFWSREELERFAASQGSLLRNHR